MPNYLYNFRSKTLADKFSAFFNLYYGKVPHITLVRQRDRYNDLGNLQKNNRFTIPHYDPDYKISFDDLGVFDVFILPSLLNLYLNHLLGNLEILRGKRQIMRPFVTNIYGDQLPMKGAARPFVFALIAISTMASLVITIPLQVIINLMLRPLFSGIATGISAIFFMPHHAFSMLYKKAEEETKQVLKSTTAVLQEKGIPLQKKAAQSPQPTAVSIPSNPPALYLNQPAHQLKNTTTSSTESTLSLRGSQ